MLCLLYMPHLAIYTYIIYYITYIIYIERDRETERQRDRETERQREIYYCFICIIIATDVIGYTE